MRTDRRMPAAAALLLALAACHTVAEPTIAAPWPATAAATPLSHADCVRMACDFGPARAGWRARYLAAAAQLRSAELLPNPQLVADWEDFRLFEHVPASALQQTFSLSWSIGDLLLRGRRMEIAAAELEATLAELEAERRDLAIAVCRAYDEVVGARQRAALAHDDAVAAVRHRDGMARLAAAGEQSPLAAATADAEAAEARAAAEAAAGDAEALELALAFALGFERPVALQLADPLPVPDATSPAPDLDAALAAAAVTRPELIAARARYAAEVERLHLAASPLRFLPVVGAGYRRLDGTQLGVGSIDVALPIFDAGGADVAAADATLLAAGANAGKVAQAVAADVCKCLADDRAARDLLHTNRELAARRAALAAAARRWFAAGEIAFAELREPERAAAQARREQLHAEQEAATASWPLRIDALLATLPPPAD